MPEAEEPESKPTATAAVGTAISPPPSAPSSSSVTAELVAAESVIDGGDVISAAQIIVSYLWNSAHERALEGQSSHIVQQLRTLSHWLTTTPLD